MIKIIKCKNCQKPIEGRFIQADGYGYHPECFTCSKCRKPIQSSFNKHNEGYFHSECYIKYIQPHCDICRLPIQGKYTTHDNKNYHISCFKDKMLPKCDVCMQALEGKYVTDWWGNKSHPKHGGKTILCNSCGRIISQSTSNGGYNLSDGRYICGICKLTAIESKTSVESLLLSVLDRLASVGISNIPKNIPINIVSKQIIIQKSNSKFSNNTRGFTQSSIKFNKKEKFSSDYIIYILFGLPKLEFEGVLAHELLHVWLNENNIKLSANETEGFCNLGAWMIYEFEKSSFAKFLLNNMENDPDPKYGLGYRRMLKKLKSRGWATLIQELKTRRKENIFSIWLKDLIGM